MSERSKSSPLMSRRAFLVRSAALGVGITALPALMAACAPAAPAATTGTGEGAAAEPAGEPVTVTWFVRDDAIVNPWEDQMVASFNEANPGIVVEWISGGTGDEREAKFTAMFAGGTPPDVFASWQNAGFGDYAARNLMLDLQPFVDTSADLDLSTIPAALIALSDHQLG